MKRGEMWIADLPPPSGRRPVLLIMRNGLYETRDDVMAARVTTRIRGINSEVSLGPDDGVARPSAVNLGDIMVFPKQRLIRHVATLTPARMREVEDAIHFILGMRCERGR